MAVAITSVENFTIEVWMARRSLGGVSITDMSRMPASPICSVRGMGVADRVRAVHRGAHVLELLLGRHPEALLLVDDEEAQVAEAHVLAAAGGGCR